MPKIVGLRKKIKNTARGGRKLFGGTERWAVVEPYNIEVRRIVIFKFIEILLVFFREPSSRRLFPWEFEEEKETSASPS